MALSRCSHTTLVLLVVVNAVLILCLGLVMYSWNAQNPSNVYRNIINESTDSSHRWTKVFRDIFDIPHPLSFQIGPDNVTFKNKYFIYRCDQDTMYECGGWGNRAKGMITAYLLANLTGKVFKSEQIMPECDLQRFIMPNHVNWSLPTSFHEKVIPSEKVKLMDKIFYKPFYDKFKQTDWIHNTVMDSDFVYFKNNFDMLDNFRDTKFYAKQLQWMQGQDRVTLNRFLFTHLFKPTSYLRNKVINFLTEHVRTKEKLLCIHLRMGKNPTIPNDIRFSINFDYLQNVWKTVTEVSLPRLGNNTKIFLMSDSTDAIAKARKQEFGYRIFISPGEIIHIELSEHATNQQKCEGLEKVLFEQLVLLHCDSIILNESSISRMSAYIRGRDDELYCFIREGPVVPCKSIDIKTIFNTRG